MNVVLKGTSVPQRITQQQQQQQRKKGGKKGATTFKDIRPNFLCLLIWDNTQQAKVGDTGKLVRKLHQPVNLCHIFHRI